MVSLQNLPVARKFTYAFGIVCGLCILLGIYTFTTFHGVSVKNSDVSNMSLPSLVHLSNIRDSLNDLRRADLDLLLCQTRTCTNQEIANRQEALQKYEAGTRAMQPFLTTDKERESFQQLLANCARYIDTSNKGAARWPPERLGMRWTLSCPTRR